ncbi:MAG TPA: SpoIIE family protein phosphatase [Streptosporangiaceae bacterium]|nr:SpoIIE family protein phosphatase [Streptosporangiaceae bacterium]
MTRRERSGLGAVLPADAVLGRIEAAVLVTDPLGTLLYANAHAVELFGFPDHAELLAGRPIASLGFDERDLGKTSELVRQVLNGGAWDGTFTGVRSDGSRVFVQAQAVPLRESSGAAGGIVVIARRAARRTNLRERDRIGLLEQIGERLARSLELDVTLRHVAETLVPQFADHCFIDLFHGDKLIRRAQINARGWAPPPGSWAKVGEQIAYPDGHFCQQAMALLDAVVVADLRDGLYPAPHAQSLRAAEEVGLVSVIAAPLCARGELLGVMSLALSRLTGSGERRYGAGDRAFMAAIADRVAIAIDNAMLFEEERRTALAFQTSLLPQRLPTLDGLDVAWRYVPAKPLETHGQGIQTQVGGDWYDLIPLSAGRVGIVIGDVEGRGARAAAVMGQLRAALRAFAQDDKPPAEMLRRLDDWCRTLGTTAPDSPDELDPPIVSCTYLVYDAWTRTLSFANAGHDAPLLITGGEVGELEIEHKGVLLGVRGKGIPGLPTYREETRQLPPGSTLVFYTDGLTDRRQRADGTGHYSEAEAVEMLRCAVHAVAGGDVEAIAQAAEEAVPGDIDDDMAILVVRTSRSDLALWECSFPTEAIRVSEARRRARAALTRWGVPAKQAELICLLVSEVVTNVVLHTALPVRRPRRVALEPAGAALGAGRQPRGWETGTPRKQIPPPPSKKFTLRLRRGAAAVWVEVFDADLRMPRIRSAEETDEGGRGLYLVDHIASRWGTRPTKNGKVVWFEMPVTAGSAAR